MTGKELDVYELYRYNENGTVSQKYTFGGKWLTLNYDALLRLQTRRIDGTNLTVHYTYKNGSGSNTTTTLVDTLTYKNGTSTQRSFGYTYDELGNITSVTDSGGENSSYTYDAQNQLTQEVIGGSTYVYSYDTYGNIRSVSGAESKTFTYGNTKWLDQLTAYNGASITYDGIGNPTSYYNGASMTWSRGRELTSYTTEEGTVSYTYGADGIRTRKVVDGVVHDYVTENGRIVADLTSQNALVFSYDENGIPHSVTVNGTVYYYITNLQGDVVEIRNASGAVVAQYSYNAWGEVLTATGTLAEVNPLRYRGYYYDAETGFYYLQSRYYDPEICRFINADNQLSAIDFGAMNLFSYCGNNPVNMSDDSGHWPKWIESAANWVNSRIIRPIANFFNPKSNTISGQFQDGIFRGSGSLTGGYSEFNGRLQINSKDNNNNGMLGGYGKISVGNASGKIGMGNNSIAISLKGVGDGLTATLQAGVQYKMAWD